MLPKKKKRTALFCHCLVHSLYLEQLSHLLLLKVNSVSEVSGDKRTFLSRHLPELPCAFFFYFRK